MTDAKRGGTNQQNRQYGAITQSTVTYLKSVDYEGAFEKALSEASNAGGASARIVDRKQNGKLLVEVQETREAFPLNTIQWSCKPSSIMERRSVDIDGNPIVVSYAPSVDWGLAGGGAGYAFQYTTYADQMAEADVYVPTKDITGRMFSIVPKGQIVSTIEGLRTWDFVINEYPFFGYEKGCVLSFGVGLSQIARRSNGDHLVEVEYRFLAKPGSPISSEGVGAGGWNSWHPWTDPNSGMVPKDVYDTEDAVVEARHYAYKDFRILYEYQ